MQVSENKIIQLSQTLNTFFHLKCATHLIWEIYSNTLKADQMLFLFQSVMPNLETKQQLKLNSYKTNPVDPVSNKSPWLRCCCSLSARDRSSVISHLIGSCLPLLASHWSLLQIRLAHCIDSPPFLLESIQRFKKRLDNFVHGFTCVISVEKRFQDILQWITSIR